MNKVRTITVVALLAALGSCTAEKTLRYHPDPHDRTAVLDATFREKLKRSDLSFWILIKTRFEGGDPDVSRAFEEFAADEGKATLRAIMSFAVQRIEGSEGEPRLAAIREQIKSHGWEFKDTKRGSWTIRADLSTGTDWLELEPSNAIVDWLHSMANAAIAERVQEIAMQVFAEVDGVVRAGDNEVAINVGVTFRGSNGQRIALKEEAGEALGKSVRDGALAFWKSKGLRILE